MDGLDLDINNYTIKDLERFFQIAPNNKYSAADIELKEAQLKEVLLSTGHIDKKFKRDLIMFLDTAKDWLITVKCKNETKNPTSFHNVPKMEKYPNVPASREAMPRMEGVDYIFPSPQGRNKPLSNMAMLNLLKKTMGFKHCTVHGFRSSFREFSGEMTPHSREVIEQAMAHQLTDQAEAAYMRGDYMRKRQVLMQDWEDYCFSANQATGTTNAVAPI